MAKSSSVIEVAIVADTKKFKKGIEGATSKLDQFTRKMGSASVKIGKGFAVMGGAAVGLSVVAGKHLFEVGEELTSLDKKIETVFSGKSLETVENWADEVAGRMGLTSTAAQGLAANAGDLLKPMGFTADEAANMSTEIVGLSGALSEWSGGQRSVEETAEILQKALLGERESLKSLGISISQAEVDQRALTFAQRDGREAITAQDRALATQALIMEKSTDAQAAFAAGGNQLTASQNMLKATMGELEETVARKLLPVFADLAAFVVADVIPVLQTELPRAFEWIEANVLPVVKRIGEGIQVAFEAVVEWVRDNWPEIRDTVTAVVDTIVDVVTVALAIITTAWDTWGDRIITLLAGLVDPVRRVIENVVGVIRGLIDFVVGVFTGDWQRAWDGIRAVFAGVIFGIAALIDLAWLQIKFAIGAIIDGVKLLWDWSFLSDWVDSAFQLGADFISAIADGIKSAPSAIKDAIAGLIPGGDIVGGAFSAVGGFLGIGATGGIVTRPTLALIGEAGPEAVVPLNRAPGASPLPGGGGGGMSVTVNMPAGSNGDDVVRALQDYQRRRGAIPVATGTARY
jgi:hypothetical protein